MTDEELMLRHCDGDPEAFPILRQRYSHVPSEIMDEIEAEPAWYWRSFFGRIRFAEHVAFAANPPDDIDDRSILDLVNVLAEDRVRLVNRLVELGEPMPGI